MEKAVFSKSHGFCTQQKVWKSRVIGLTQLLHSTEVWKSRVIALKSCDVEMQRVVGIKESACIDNMTGVH
jgi:hypothetical protein